jgi:hypothetical protein
MHALGLRQPRRLGRRRCARGCVHRLVHRDIDARGRRGLLAQPFVVLGAGLEAAAWRNPANADCLACLFSIEEDSSYGPLILLANGSIQTNIPGCMALIDGDASAMGCGAKYQAYYDCIEAACGSNCPTYDDYVTCSSTARIGVCAPLLQQAVCRRRPEYASCNAYTTFEEYFFAIAKMFCSPGSDGGTTMDAGVGPGEAGVDDAAVPEAGSGDP